MKGFTVVIKFKKDGRYAGETRTMKNVTEIHYNYESLCKHIPEIGIQIAFESDIDRTGCTLRFSDIEEFEAKEE